MKTSSWIDTLAFKLAGGNSVPGSELDPPRASSAHQQATPVAIPQDEKGFGQSYLFVQTFANGTFVSNPNAGTPIAIGTPAAGVHGEFLLTLSGHPGETIYFSDQPERIAGDGSTASFLENLGFEASNPPNAALVTRDNAGIDAVIVLELMNPVIDEDGGTITYEATVLEDFSGGGLQHLIAQNSADAFPDSFGSASLYIDDCPPVPVWCYPSGAQCCQDTGCTPTWIDYSTMGGCWSWSKFDCLPCHDQSQWCNDHYGRCNDNCFGLDHDCQPPP